MSTTAEARPLCTKCNLRPAQPNEVRRRPQYARCSQCQKTPERRRERKRKYKLAHPAIVSEQKYRWRLRRDIARIPQLKAQLEKLTHEQERITRQLNRHRKAKAAGH